MSKAEALLKDALLEVNANLRNETGRARGALTHQRWRIHQMISSTRQYFSQSGQDWFVDNMLLKERRNGVFVDVGGYDGVSGSNTLFFETFRGWSGLLIEAVPALAEQAAAVRRCPCVSAVLSGDGMPKEFLRIDQGYLQMSGRIDTYDQRVLDRVASRPDHRADRSVVETQRLSEILTQHGIEAVDYMSVDVEGAELDILQSFPFDSIRVDVISVENTVGTRGLHTFLTTRNYQLVEFLGVDEMYCRTGLMPAA